MATDGKNINIKFPFQDSPTGDFLGTNIVSRDAIKSNLIHLLLTNKGERLYLPTFGTGLRRFIFEQNDGVTNSDIKREIEQSISDFIPNLRLVNFAVENDENKAIVNIDYAFSDGVFEFTDSVRIEF